MKASGCGFNRWLETPTQGISGADSDPIQHAVYMYVYNNCTLWYIAMLASYPGLQRVEGQGTRLIAVYAISQFCK